MSSPTVSKSAPSAATDINNLKDLEIALKTVENAAEKAQKQFSPISAWKGRKVTSFAEGFSYVLVLIMQKLVSTKSRLAAATQIDSQMQNIVSQAKTKLMQYNPKNATQAGQELTSAGKIQASLERIQICSTNLLNANRNPEKQLFDRISQNLKALTDIEQSCESTDSTILSQLVQHDEQLQQQVKEFQSLRTFVSDVVRVKAANRVSKPVQDESQQLRLQQSQEEIQQLRSQLSQFETTIASQSKELEELRQKTEPKPEPKLVPEDSGSNLQKDLDAQRSELSRLKAELEKTAKEPEVQTQVGPKIPILESAPTGLSSSSSTPPKGQDRSKLSGDILTQRRQNVLDRTKDLLVSAVPKPKHDKRAYTDIYSNLFKSKKYLTSSEIIYQALRAEKLYLNTLEGGDNIILDETSKRLTELRSAFAGMKEQEWITNYHQLFDMLETYQEFEKSPKNDQDREKITEKLKLLDTQISWVEHLLDIRKLLVLYPFGYWNDPQHIHFWNDAECVDQSILVSEGVLQHIKKPFFTKNRIVPTNYFEAFEVGISALNDPKLSKKQREKLEANLNELMRIQKENIIDPVVSLLKINTQNQDQKKIKDSLIRIGAACFQETLPYSTLRHEIKLFIEIITKIPDANLNDMVPISLTLIIRKAKQLLQANRDNPKTQGIVASRNKQNIDEVIREGDALFDAVLDAKGEDKDKKLDELFQWFTDIAPLSDDEYDAAIGFAKRIIAK